MKELFTAEQTQTKLVRVVNLNHFIPGKVLSQTQSKLCMYNFSFFFREFFGHARIILSTKLKVRPQGCNVQILQSTGDHDRVRVPHTLHLHYQHDAGINIKGSRPRIGLVSCQRIGLLSDGAMDT